MQRTIWTWKREGLGTLYSSSGAHVTAFRNDDSSTVVVLEAGGLLQKVAFTPQQWREILPQLRRAVREAEENVDVLPMHALIARRHAEADAGGQRTRGK